MLKASGLAGGFLVAAKFGNYLNWAHNVLIEFGKIFCG